MGRMAVQGAGEREEENSTDMLKVNVDGMAPPRVVGRDAAENFDLQVTYRLMQMESPLE